jgi:hypothetical protein
MKYVANIANWILGVLFFIVSLMSIISFSFVPGLFLLIASLMLMPISRRFILPKINEKMSPMIRGALVSILLIGFVVSVQPNEAQLLAEKEIKLAEEAALEESALLEQQQIAKAAGFLSVEEYEEAKSVEMPTKAFYDTYLEQQAEIKMAKEKLKAEKAEKAEKERVVENAEAKKLNNLKIHISNGGSYALINIWDLDKKLFFGKNCSEILSTYTKLKPGKNTVSASVINGVNGEVAVINNIRATTNYKMPKNCNLFAGGNAELKSSCGLSGAYTNEIYEKDAGTNIVTKFGRLKWLGGLDDYNAWKVKLDTDGNSLRSRFYTLSWAQYDDRGIICRN